MSLTRRLHWSRAVAEKDFKPGPEGEPNEKTIREAATAENDFQSGPEVEPIKRKDYTSSSSRKSLGQV